jgi:hypothetical protein
MSTGAAVAFSGWINGISGIFSERQRTPLIRNSCQTQSSPSLRRKKYGPLKVVSRAWPPVPNW